MENNNIYAVNSNFDWINEIGWNCKTVELKTTCSNGGSYLWEEMWLLCASAEQNDYNEAPEAFLTLLVNAKTLDIQKPNPRRWNTKSHVGPVGKLV